MLLRTSGSGLQLVEYLASQLFPFELERFQLAVGDPAGQAVWEALAVLVAIRAWRSYWCQSSCTTVEVRCDSLAASGAARRISSRDPKLKCVMQELSLQVAVHGLNIGLLAHTPGLANMLPDTLSCRHQSGSWQLPQGLVGIRERVIAPRLATWWLARNGPAHFV